MLTTSKVEKLMGGGGTKMSKKTLFWTEAKGQEYYDLEWFVNNTRIDTRRMCYEPLTLDLPIPNCFKYAVIYQGRTLTFYIVRSLNVDLAMSSPDLDLNSLILRRWFSFEPGVKDQFLSDFNTWYSYNQRIAQLQGI